MRSGKGDKSTPLYSGSTGVYLFSSRTERDWTYREVRHERDLRRLSRSHIPGQILMNLVIAQGMIPGASQVCDCMTCATEPAESTRESTLVGPLPRGWGLNSIPWTRRKLEKIVFTRTASIYACWWIDGTNISWVVFTLFHCTQSLWFCFVLFPHI